MGVRAQKHVFFLIRHLLRAWGKLPNPITELNRSNKRKDFRRKEVEVLIIGRRVYGGLHAVVAVAGHRRAASSASRGRTPTAAQSLQYFPTVTEVSRAVSPPKALPALPRHRCRVQGTCIDAHTAGHIQKQKRARKCKGIIRARPSVRHKK